MKTGAALKGLFNWIESQVLRDTKGRSRAEYAVPAGSC